MENNNELLVKVDSLVLKIAELEKQMDTLKNENVKLQNEINLEKKG
jgi:cell division protein FtsB